MDAIRTAANAAAEKVKEGYHAMASGVTGSQVHEQESIKSHQEADSKFDEARMQARSMMLDHQETAPVVVEKPGKKLFCFVFLCVVSFRLSPTELSLLMYGSMQT